LTESHFTAAKSLCRESVHLTFKQGSITEGEGSVQLTSSLRYLVL
jgi:hypothetical protein